MKILKYPTDNKALRASCAIVNDEMRKSPEFLQNVEEMKRLIKLDGMGLAASQVGWPVQVFLMSQNQELQDIEPKVFINPTILDSSNSRLTDSEGCLSFPGLVLKLSRPHEITWVYSDLDGIRHTVDSNGYYARAIQHEIDHLNGMLFIDRADILQKLKIKKWEKKLGTSS